ncbi:hypothetical protein B1756_13020 [Natrarchaeobaculum aegyptiacum]|uniref:Uncharacterized protein n=1 Tax=Natrarchaeobaculum aegyptiacum TaxID=745377 RepID=A0A2Z2HUU3_9EURY|nr:hypothetical protein B1756_13020 [Natrarchaeobaculum aegyptiacum]
MVSRLTIHSDCGTDIRIVPTDDPPVCPDCTTAFRLSLVDRSTTDSSTHAPGTRNGSVSYRGP